MAGIWWTKVDLKEDFCEHFCEMTDKEIVSDIRKSINSILKQRPDGNDFGAKMVKKAIERVKSKHDKAVSSGALGGAAKARNKKEKHNYYNLEITNDKNLLLNEANSFGLLLIMLSRLLFLLLIIFIK